MRAMAIAALLACACEGPSHAPDKQAVGSPTGRINLAARLAGPRERETLPDPQVWGPYVHCRRLHAEDHSAQADLERAFPGCSLSAWELDTCGTMAGAPMRFSLGIVEARTRERLCGIEINVGDDRMRLLVAAQLTFDRGVQLVQSFSVYR